MTHEHKEKHQTIKVPVFYKHESRTGSGYKKSTLLNFTSTTHEKTNDILTLRINSIIVNEKFWTTQK